MAIQQKRFVLLIPKAEVDSVPKTVDFFAKVKEIMAAFEKHVADAGYGVSFEDRHISGSQMLSWPGQWMQPEAGDKDPCYWFCVRAFRVASGPSFTLIQDGVLDTYRYTGDTQNA